MREPQVEEVGRLITRALAHRDDETVLDEVRRGVAKLAAEHPPYPEDFPGHV